VASIVKVHLRPAAVDDLEATRKYYEDARPRLGHEFVQDLDRLFGRLAMFPNSAALVAGHEPVRRARLRRFPYAVFYLPGDEGLEILRIVHTARSPDTWRA
jgi:toxin ParE1/3/4